MDKKERTSWVVSCVVDQHINTVARDKEREIEPNPVRVACGAADRSFKNIT